MFISCKKAEDYVRSVSREVKLTLFSASALMGMHSIYIRLLVHPVAAPLLMGMRGYTGGVATVRVLAYPAISHSKWLPISDEDK